MISRSAPISVTLGELLGDMVCPQGLFKTPISALCQDSRKVQPGNLFFALSGANTSGTQYIAEASERGAVAVAIDADDQDTLTTLDPRLPMIPISNLAMSLSGLAAKFYQMPSKDLRTIAVTGTNGKTSCCWMLSHLLEFLGDPSAYLGTLGYGLARRGESELPSAAFQETGYTTPDAITTQRILAELRDSGARCVALEASSHGLLQGRIEAVGVDTAIFTNLSRDHLDYHQDMDSYGEAKARLFQMPGLRQAVINYDDSFGRKLVTRMSSSVATYTYSLDNPKADVFCTSVDLNAQGIKASVTTPWGSGELYSQLVGQFNLANVLAVLAATGAHYPFGEILRHIPSLRPAAGRMELVDTAHGPSVVVDFAHTPDALEKVLITLRAHCRAKIWVVFGCGGERDIGKRAKMGSIAERYADRVVLTSDNPRTESEHAIIAHIERGIIGRASVEIDRRAAIRRAIFSASSEDMVLIAGKGHEGYQQLADRRLSFSDQVQARLALRDRQVAPL